MKQFLATILAAFIGGFFAPLVVDFLKFRHSKRNMLRKAYKTTKEIYNYISTINAYNLIMIKHLSTKPTPNIFQFFFEKCNTESPINKLEILLRFDLKYPKMASDKLISSCLEMDAIKWKLIKYLSDNKLPNNEDTNLLSENSNRVFIDVSDMVREIKEWCINESENLSLFKQIKLFFMKNKCLWK